MLSFEQIIAKFDKSVLRFAVFKQCETFFSFGNAIFRILFRAFFSKESREGAFANGFVFANGFTKLFRGGMNIQ